MRLIAQFRNTVVLGDCVEVMRRMESASVDFILIDPLPLSLRVVTLDLAGEIFIRSVREILDVRPISRLPHAPDFLLGMFDVRGSGQVMSASQTRSGAAAVKSRPAATGRYQLK